MNEQFPTPDREQLRELFRAEALPLLSELLRIAVILTGDVNTAEDVVQESMMRAYRHIDQFEPGTNMRAWLMTILRRTSIDQYRKETRHQQVGSLDAMAIEPQEQELSEEIVWSSPDDLLASFDDEAISSALRRLPDEMRWTLLLVDVQQMSVAEAAESLDVPEGTIKSRASRARQKLRSILVNEHPERFERNRAQRGVS